MPPDFFTAPIDPSGPTAVEAEQLIFDATTDTITATGDVLLRASGYVVSGDSLVYRRASGEAEVVGNVTVTDPSGNVSRSTVLKLTGGMRQAFLDALVITAYDGSRITADSADYDRAVRTILNNASYAPCGECVDSAGRRIGWSISAARIVQNAEDNSVALEQPTLSLLGVPVAWLPYLWLPDLSNDALQRVPKPTFGYTEKIGARAEFVFTPYSTATTDIILSPTLLSRQGFLMGVEWRQRFDNGSFRIKASGLYQFDKMAFTFADAQREWRGALQSAGEFTPVKDWQVGFAYAAFTDSAYFGDYLLNPDRAAVNEIYATHLTADTYVDARLQQFNLLGDNTNQTRAQQGMALPNVTLERTFNLGPDGGQVEVESRLLGIYREADNVSSYNGVDYDLGYAGTRLHGMGQASWQNQYILGGAVATPFAGVRLDATYFDGNSGLARVPADQALLSATPIAALDVRYPLVAASPGVTHLVEPIAQIVYRGAGSIAPGITNEDAQSVVFDDTNLFSYNRFTGIDRQETGLRLNVGARYLATLDDGSYAELVAGQSFQLAGTNAFASPNTTQAGVGSGLENAASYAVIGAYGRSSGGWTASGKVQLDTSDLSLARASLGVGYSRDRWRGSVNYRFAEAVPAAGAIRDQHEVGVDLGVPIAEYWTLTGNAYWDINARSYLLVGGGLNYDDGYLGFGINAARTGPTHTSGEGLTVLASFSIKAPAGLGLGYSGAVPVSRFLGGQ